MPDFEISGPDGAKYQLTAPDEAAALAAFSTFSGKASRETPVSATDVVRSAAEGVPVVGSPALLNRANAAINATLAPAVEPFLDKGPETLDQPTWAERYNRSLELQNKRDAKFAKEHPVIDTTAKVAGGILGTAPLVMAAPAAMGAVGTVPQMVARGAASGAALSAADAAARGEDVVHGAELGGITGAAAGPIGRVIGKGAGAIKRALSDTTAVPVPRETMRVGGVDVPVPTTDPATAMEVEAARRGARGDAAQRVVQGADQEAEQALEQAGQNVGRQFDAGGAPAAGRVGRSPQEAADLVAQELGAAEQTRFQTEQAARQRADALGDQTRTEMATDLYTGRPMDVARDAFTAAEGMGTGVENARTAAVRERNRFYRGVRDTPGTFDPSVPQGLAEDIRARLNTGEEPLWVGRNTESVANRALNMLDETVGNGIFRNAAAPREAAGPGGLPGVAQPAQSAAQAAYDELVARGVAPERARAAVARVDGAEGIGAAPRGVLEPHDVATPDGRSVAVQPKVVEADAIRASSDAKYDPDLQPRNRKRAASDVQVQDMAKNLNPQRLGASSEADRGAPIVGPDGMVESGNGRVMAIRQAYAENGPAAQRYRNWLAAQGVDTAGMKNPVLVRERTTPMNREERKAFTVAANQSSTLSMSAAERALADSRALSPDTLGLIRNPGDLGAVENRDFVRQFMGALPQTERGALMTANGDLSAEGLARVRNAVLAKAYGDSPVLARIAESTKDEVKSISSGLTAAAPEWARLRADVAAGAVPAEMDITPHLLDAVERTARLRGRGGSLESGLAQADAFSKQSPESEAIMRMFYDADGKRAAPAGKIADGLRGYAQEAAKVDASPGLGLGLEPVKPADILAGQSAKIGAPKALAPEVTEAAAAKPAVEAAGRIADQAPELTLRQMDKARQQLVEMYKDARKAAQAQGGSGSDERAMRRILAEFDNAIIDAFESGKFSGDSEVARRLMQQARAAHAQYRETFTRRSGQDPIGADIEKILGRHGDTRATPDEIISMAYGGRSEPGGGRQAKLAQRLREIVGPTSPEWGQYKQGLVSLLDDRSLSAAKRADRIDAFLTQPKGRILAQTVLSADERAALGRYAENLRAAEPQPLSELKGADKIVARITGRDGGVPATTDEVVKLIFGTPQSGASGAPPFLLAQKLKGSLSPEGWDSLRGGMWSHLIERPPGVTEWSHRKVAENISNFLNRDISKVYFSAPERAEMRAYADARMRHAPIPGTTNPSGTAPMLTKIASKTGRYILPLVGLAHGGVPGAIVGEVGQRAVTGLKNAKAARDVKKLLYDVPAVPIDPRFAKAGAMLSRSALPGLLSDR